MFLLMFFLVFAATTTINNSLKEIKEGSLESYEYDSSSRKIILIVLAVSILLQALYSFSGISFIKERLGIILLSYGVVSFVSIMVANKLRMEAIEKSREEKKLVFESIKFMLPGGDKKEFDPNNIPFSLEYEKGKIRSITVEYEDPTKYNDTKATISVENMNRVFPHAVWILRPNMQERKCVLEGTKLPPSMAKYPGSWLRPIGWIPVGVNGISEIGWNMGAKSKVLGRSMFKYEDGASPKTADISSSPQAFAVGTSGGGKAIWIEQEVEVM